MPCSNWPACNQICPGGNDRGGQIERKIAPLSARLGLVQLQALLSLRRYRPSLSRPLFMRCRVLGISALIIRCPLITRPTVRLRKKKLMARRLLVARVD